MGRATTSQKRRPKGKKGWAKIDISSNIRQPSSEPLFYIDTKNRKLSKKQKKLLAQQSLQSTGHSISTISDLKNEKKNILLKNKQNKKIIKNYKNSNFIKNIPKNKQTKSQKLKLLNNSSTYRVINYKPYDLWDINNDNNNNNNNNIKINKNDNNNIKNIKNEINFELNENKKILNNLNINKKKFKDMKGKLVKNRFVPQSVGISLPGNGESVNPLKVDYYEMNCNANKLKYKQLFYKLWQNKKTREWHKSIWGKIAKNEKKLEYYSKKWKKEKLKYIKSKQEWIKKINNINDKNEKIIKNVERQIILDKNNNNNNILRTNEMNKIKYNGWGINYKKVKRWNKLNNEKLISKNMRNNVGTKTENVVSWMFNELRQQNRIQPKKKVGYIRRRTTFLGPRFKVQTRIGKLFHDNVNDRIHNVKDE